MTKFNIQIWNLFDFLSGSSNHNSRSSNFDEILSNMGPAADQFLDEDQLKYLIGLLRDKINEAEREKNQDLSEIDEDFHGFSDIKPHIYVPETVPETIPETVSELVQETVSAKEFWKAFQPSFVSATVSETVSETVSKTVSETVPDKYRPKNRTRTRRRRKPKWLRTTTTKVGWNTPTGFYYNQTS